MSLQKVKRPRANVQSVMAVLRDPNEEAPANPPESSGTESNTKKQKAFDEFAAKQHKEKGNEYAAAGMPPLRPYVCDK